MQYADVQFKRANVQLCSLRGLSLIVQFKGVEYSSCAVCNVQLCSSRGLNSIVQFQGFEYSSTGVQCAICSCAVQEG